MAETDTLRSAKKVTPLQRTSLLFDLERAQDSLKQILSEHPLALGQRSLSFTHSEPNCISVDNRPDPLFDFKTRIWHGRESQFRYFHPQWQQTYFYEIYQRLQEVTDNGVGRFRLMILWPWTCYPVHADPTPRLHFVLQTNEQSFFIFANARLIHLPADPHFYFVDTRYQHTAMNGGDQKRIHLVVSLSEEFRDYDLLFR